MIRKSGWLVMLVVLALVFALVYLFAGFAIRLSSVYTLEKTFGAEVNIGDVDVSLAPLALDIEQLQITDKNNPDKNLFSFAQARAAFTVWPALMGYYVIDEVSVDGFEVGSNRAQPGKIYRGEAANAEEKFDLTDTLKLDFPAADELVSRAQLQTGERGKALSEQAQRQRENISELQKQLPTKQRLDELQQQITALTESDIENAADLAQKVEELKAVKKAIEAEHDKLLAVKDGVGSSRQALEDAVQDLRNASEQDWQKLQNLANLDNGGLASLSQILLGDYWGKRIGQLQSLYLLAKPYLPESSKSSDEQTLRLPNRILPLTNKPYPNLWIKEARINWLVAGGTATVSLKDVTRDHPIIDAPTILNVKAENMPRMDTFNLQGEFSIFETMTTDLSWTLDGFQLQSHQFNLAGATLELNEGKLNSNGTLNLKNSNVNQSAEISLVNPAFAPSDNSYLKPLVDSLNQQSKIPITLSATGYINDPDISVRSPLDRLLGDAMLGEAKKKVALYEQELKEKLDTKLKEELKGQEQWLSDLNSQESAIDALETRIEDMLSAELADIEDSAKKNLKDSLKDRLLK